MFLDMEMKATMSGLSNVVGFAFLIMACLSPFVFFERDYSALTKKTPKKR